MSNPPTPDVHAGEVPCGPALYEVIDAHEHKTLKVGDLVRMVEDPHYNNWLLRTDNTLHALQNGQGDLYVWLRLATGSMTRHDHYTADQMHAYAAEQMAAERERILSRCQGKTHDGCAYLGRCGMVCNKCGQVA